MTNVQKARLPKHEELFFPEVLQRNAVRALKFLLDKEKAGKPRHYSKNLVFLKQEGRL
jgi:hypothetical protein